MDNLSVSQKASWHLNADLQNAIARVTLEQASLQEFEEVKAIALHLLEQNYLLKEMLGEEILRGMGN
jgi:hypothetical protein